MADRISIVQFGRNGQLAAALQEAAANNGISLNIIGRDEADFSIPNASARALARIASVDAVINAAAYTAVDAAEDDEANAMAVNGDAVGALAGACAERKIPLIHISTDYVFDGLKTSPYVESDTPNPLNAYGRSKLAGEENIRAVLDRHVILRTSWVYGPQGKNFVKTMLALALRNKELRIVSDQIGAPTSSFELARAVLQVAKKNVLSPSPADWGTFHFAGRGETSWADFAEAIFAGALPEALRPWINRIASSEYPTPALRPMNSRLNCDKIRAVYGIDPLHWRDALQPVLRRLGDTKGGAS